MHVGRRERRARLTQPPLVVRVRRPRREGGGDVAPHHPLDGLLAALRDGAVEGGEQCEAGVPLADTCVSLGFDSGTLSCDAANCSYDTSGCVGGTCAGNKEACSTNSDCCSNNCKGGACKGN